MDALSSLIKKIIDLSPFLDTFNGLLNGSFLDLSLLSFFCAIGLLRTDSGVAQSDRLIHHILITECNFDFRRVISKVD